MKSRRRGESVIPKVLRFWIPSLLLITQKRDALGKLKSVR